AEIEEELARIIDNPETEVDEQSAARMNAWLAKWRNRNLSDSYEPGSTFKTITLAIALEEGVVNENSTFFCAGTSTDIPGRVEPLHCSNSTAHGLQTLAQAVQNSCNIAFAHIGLLIGAERFYDYIEAFGFKGRTGIDLSGEATGLWWDDAVFKSDNKSQLASASFGQTFTITPIQLITAISATVNGGILYKPHVVKQITGTDGAVVESNAPTAVRQVISAETSATVRELLESAVSNGSGKNGQVAGYRVGGKTGTSVKTTLQAVTGEKEYIVSFVGIAPINDPQIVILLLLDTPSASSGVGIYGSQMAAPTVRNILAEVLPYMGIEPEYSDEETQNINISVPKLAELTLAEAQKKLRDLRLDYKVIGDGDTVTAQLPAANARVSPNTKVLLYTGAPPEDSTVIVPNLAGRSYASAKALLEERGLFIRSTGIAPGMIHAVVQVQSMPSGESAAYGTVIEVQLVDSSVEGIF
ncbi:MAG: PASTA domain-containing protein, partial [Oscillospiraceae bacterium]|nr:PASTA domain-containing protein [Oscillospiraceae bacterium]